MAGEIRFTGGPAGYMKIATEMAGQDVIYWAETQPLDMWARGRPLAVIRFRYLRGYDDWAGRPEYYWEKDDTYFMRRDDIDWSPGY